MKELDIEKLSKKTPYKMSSDIFEEVQSNVFQNIKPEAKKETKVKSLVFYWSVAASIVLIVGIMVFLKFGKPVGDNQPVIAQQIVEPKIDSSVQNTDNIQQSNQAPLAFNKGNSEKNELGSNRIITNNNDTRPIVKTENSVEETLDKTISSLSSEDVSSLSYAEDQDTYLELY